LLELKKMHELRIAEDLSSIVIETAIVNNLSKVTRVNIIFGQMIRIVPDIFEFAFRETVRDSIAENAELIIAVLPLKLKCSGCDREFQVDDNTFACKICSSTDIDIIQGEELYIKSIEGE
jgi:hydrogenase nickel incorporation protein HypA/HybF